MEGYFLISVWLIQSIIYALLTFKLVKWKIKKVTVLYISIGLFLIAPWLFPIGGYNPETGEYICGLASIIPFSIFWLFGNVGNLILILVFSLLGSIRVKNSQE